MNNRTFLPHFEILPPEQRHIWPELRPVASMGYVLYGGTALSLRFGHRTSVDFDFFSERPLVKGDLFSALSFASKAIVLQDTPDTFSLSVPGKSENQRPVKISFFGTISFGRIDQPEFTEDHILQVAGLTDLMATKLKVILQRAEAKDYRDIAAMIASGVDLSRGLAGARALFGNAFQPAESLKALTYFDDGDLETLTWREKQVLIESAKKVGDLPSVAIYSQQLSNTDTNFSPNHTPRG